MKTLLLAIVLFALIFCAGAQISTNEPSRFKTKITSYQGKMGAGTKTSTTTALPENPGASGSETVTDAGRESELKWVFVGCNGPVDVYRFTFTRRTTPDSASRTTLSKEVQFAGRQIVVFQDDLHTVVMESPSAEDLEPARKP